MSVFGRFLHSVKEISNFSAIFFAFWAFSEADDKLVSSKFKLFMHGLLLATLSVARTML